MKEKKKTIKTARYYFDEEEFVEMIHEYQKTTIVRDKAILVKNAVLEKKLVDRVMKIVRAIIMFYRYYIFEDYDDLVQHAMLACYNNFLKFNQKKGTAFNYFSIIAKISLLNYTDRRKKHRNHKNIEEQIFLESMKETNYDLIIDNMEDSLFQIVDENYVGKTRKKYITITSLIIDYLRKTKKFISKSDLYSWCRSYGIKNTEIRGFINEVKKYNKEIFEGVNN